MTGKLPPGPSSHFDGELPRAVLNVGYLKLRLADTDVLPNQHDAVIAALQKLADDYLAGRYLQASAATPAQVHAYHAKLTEAVAALRTLLTTSSPDGNAAAAIANSVLARAEMNHGLDPHLTRYVLAELSDLQLKVAAVAVEIGQPQRGGAKAILRKRQEKFAGALIEIARRFQLPLDTNGNGFLAQVLGNCLAAMEDPHSHPDRLLDDVQWSNPVTGENMRKAMGLSKGDLTD